MKKLILLSLMIVIAFAAEKKSQTVVVRSPDQVIENPGITDLNPPVNPIVQRLYEAKRNRDWTTYHQLLEEWKSEFEAPKSEESEIRAINPNERPLLRWGEDRIIFAGDVAYNAWSLENEAISVDHHRGDTLRAVVVTADSSVQVFQSNDNGQTWSWLIGWASSGRMFTEPEIINDPLGRWYHVFCMLSGNNNDLIVITDSTPGGWFYRIFEGTADTVANYSVCSDRADYPNEYWLYCAFHKQLGGQGEDEIWFIRSFDYGETWETPRRLLFNGSGHPDLTYGSYDYLYETYLWWASDNYKYIRTKRSTDLGQNWLPSVTVFSDTTTKQGPQIAAAHDGSGDAWVIFPRRDPISTNYDFGLLWSWSQDFGATWSSCGYVNSLYDYHEILPSIAIYDTAGYYYPNVTFNSVYYDFNQPPVVYSFDWETDSTWSETNTYNDSTPEYSIRPVQTFVGIGFPAIAYVGSAGHNVYFDAWSMVGVEEQKATTPKEALLSHNQPNPFTNRTQVQYYVPQNGRVSMKVYNTLGKEVVKLVDEYKKAGVYSITLNREELGRDILPAGVYFLKLEVNNAKTTRKIIIQ